MFKNFLKNFSLKTAEKEIKDYTQKVSMLTLEDRGDIFAYSCLTFFHLVRAYDIDIEKIVNTKDDIYCGELSDLVLHTNSLLKDYNRAGEMQGAAGTKVWNETFRCLVHPELTHYGKEMWGYFAEAHEEATRHLDTIEEIFKRKDKKDLVSEVKSARKYLSLIPARFK